MHFYLETSSFIPCPHLCQCHHSNSGFFSTPGLFLVLPYNLVEVHFVLLHTFFFFNKTQKSTFWCLIREWKVVSRWWSHICYDRNTVRKLGPHLTRQDLDILNPTLLQPSNSARHLGKSTNNPFHPHRGCGTGVRLLVPFAQKRQTCCSPACGLLSQSWPSQRHLPLRCTRRREDEYTESFESLSNVFFLFNWQALFYSCTCGTSHGKNRSFFARLFFLFNLIKNEIGPKNIERNKFKFTKNCTLSKSH